MPERPVPIVTPVELREPTRRDVVPVVKPITPAPALPQKTMKDPRTTITAIVTGIAAALAYFDILIPESLLPVIIGIGTVALGFFAKDGSKPAVD